MAEPAPAPLSGSCLCAAVLFEVWGPAREIGNCQCSQCRKAYGAAFGTVAVVAAGDFSSLCGTEQVASYRQSERVTRYFCARCGSPLPLLERWDPSSASPRGCSTTTPASGRARTASSAPR